jgi:hypothetical protein
MLKGTTKRKYTAEFREATVRLVTVEKVPAARAVTDLGVPIHT